MLRGRLISNRAKIMITFSRLLEVIMGKITSNNFYFIVSSYELRVTGCGLRVTGYGLDRKYELNRSKNRLIIATIGYYSYILNPQLATRNSQPATHNSQPTTNLSNYVDYLIGGTYLVKGYRSIVVFWHGRTRFKMMIYWCFYFDKQIVIKIKHLIY